jgi:hypothetical protein
MACLFVFLKKLQVAVRRTGFNVGFHSGDILLSDAPPNLDYSIPWLEHRDPHAARHEFRAHPASAGETPLEMSASPIPYR